MPKKSFNHQPPKKPTAQFTDDNFYHQFFSNAEVVADLLRMLHVDLFNELDIHSLTHVSNEFISADMRARRGDVFWKVKWHKKNLATKDNTNSIKEDGWLYIYILLEFKSNQDRFCLLQVLEYLALAYRSLEQNGGLTATRKLPPLLPIVLYNGDTPWKQPKTLAKLIEPGPEFFKPYIPEFNLFVLDENDYQDAPLETNSLVSAIFKFENTRELANLHKLGAAFLAWFNAHPNQQLKESIITWIKHSLKNVLSPDILDQINTIEELSPMFATRAQAFLYEKTQTAWQGGKQEGHQEGRQALQNLLLKTLNRFGQPIPDYALTLIADADLHHLQALIDQALDSHDLHAWLETLRQQL